MDRNLQNEESSSNLTKKPLQRKYRTVHINNYKTLTPKADFSLPHIVAFIMQDILQSEESLIALNIANSSDCRILKKIPHFACFSCNKMLQSEESDLNMKAMLSFLRVLVMREIPHFADFHCT